MAEPDDAPTTQIPLPQRQKRRIPLWALILTGGLTLAVVTSLLVAAIALRDDEPAPAADEKLQVVEYETPSDPGDDPFTTVADVEGSEVVRFTPGPGSADRSEPFGGSGSLHVCDREKLVDFLLSHPQQRRAWAGVLDIEPDEDSVSRYIRSLTPVTLTVDTRVTNHNFVNGRAVPFQSILAAGTAVLVDKYGRPVVRCKCGNPLLEPINYPRIRCKGCPPNYHPPKWCKWRIYDPWYPYPPEWLPPEWRDPYPKYYPKPEPWVYKHGKYCYILYPDPPEVTYPPRWYPPQPTYRPPPKYYPKPTYTPRHDDDDDDDDHYTPSPHDEDDTGCCGNDDGHDDESEHDPETIVDTF
jgi:hypothetical protein